MGCCRGEILACFHRIGDKPSCVSLFLLSSDAPFPFLTRNHLLTVQSKNAQDRLTTAELLNSRWFIEQGVHGREEAVELMAEYLEGLYGPHAFKYFDDVGNGANPGSESAGSGLFT